MNDSTTEYDPDEYATVTVIGDVVITVVIEDIQSPVVEDQVVEEHQGADGVFITNEFSVG
jgi:hypothetical protein